MIWIKNKLIFLIFSAVIGLLCFYVGDNVGCAYRLAEGDMLEKLSYLGENFSAVVITVHFSFAAKDILWGLAAVCCWALFVLYTVYGGKNLRPGEEHGSARWGDKTDLIANRLIDRKYENNMLFTSTERMSLNTRQTLRNNNALIIGGSGSGKTRFWVKPNILQMHTSFVVTDPNGLLYRGSIKFINWRCTQ